MELVKFQVDMKNVTAVSANGVHVAGAFQGWDPSKSQMVNYNGNGSYAGTVYTYLGYVVTGTGTEFKYVNDNTWGGAESVPSSCAVNSNRATGNVANDTVLTKVCFGSCEACPSAPIPVYNVTFQVDMSTTCAFDSVDVAGGKLNNWAGGDRLMPMSAGSSIHVITMALDSGEIEYKFRKILGGNVSWEGVANRKANLTSDTTLALTCFDKDTLCTPLPAPADVKFIVDLSSEIPDPNGDVFVMGNFTEPNWQSGAIKMTPIAGQIGMYEVTFPAMCPGSFAFKFSNGPVTNVANEENFPNANDRGCVVDNGVGGYNRLYTRTDASPKTVGFVFNTCTQATVGINDTKLGAYNVVVYPNPSEDNTTILFNDKGGVRQISVSDLSGRVIATYSNVIGSEYSFSTSTFTAGVYFVSISNDRNEQATVKLMVR
jgi:Secretion system C-terminal sorting domain